MKYSDRINQIISLLTFLISANRNPISKNDFVNKIIKSIRNNSLTEICEIEKRRKALANSKESINVLDLGAHSTSSTATKKMSISYIGKVQAKPKYQALVLHNIARKLIKPNIIELGTSAGLTTSYLSKAIPEGTIYTLEGCQNIQKIALETFTKIEAKNITTILGNFDDTLDSTLSSIKNLDLLYIDGNHTYDATIDYFKKALPYTHEDSIIVFDDIYWSKGMTKAWREIISNERISHSVDMFYFGLVFFQKESTKEHLKFIHK